MNRTRMLAALVIAALVGVTPVAQAQEPAGPPLETPAAVLDAALACPSTFAPDRTPVLLVHGTASTPQESWGHGYVRALARRGYSVCTVRLPDRSLGDAQTSAEYVVSAIRTVSERAGRQISVIGHSQGGILAMWALRFWPDLAPRVDDYIGLASPYHGSLVGNTYCHVRRTSCNPAAWQLSVGSRFNEALTAAPVTPGPSYSVVYTYTDELVQPVSTTFDYAGVTKAAVQQLCPGRLVDHVTILNDNPSFALVVDALEHPGPVVRQRVSRLECLRINAPGSELFGPLRAVPGLFYLIGGDGIVEEPPLRGYAEAVLVDAA